MEGSTRICPPKGTKQPEGCNPAENQFFINGVYVSEDQARVIIADLKKQLKVETDRMKYVRNQQPATNRTIARGSLVFDPLHRVLFLFFLRG